MKQSLRAVCTAPLLVLSVLISSAPWADELGMLRSAHSPQVDVVPWQNYQIIMWQPQSATQYAALKHLGITAGVVHLSKGDQPAQQDIEPLLRSGLRWYVENIATDFYSAYHRWFQDRPVNWRFETVKRLYDENPLNPSALIRDPSLSDPKWL